MDPKTRQRIDDLMCELEKLAASSDSRDTWHLEARHRERLEEILKEIAACGDEKSLERARNSLRRILPP